MASVLAWSDVLKAAATIVAAIIAAGVAWLLGLPRRQQRELQRSSALVEARLTAYRNLLREMEPFRGPRSEPVAVSMQRRWATAREFRRWFYREGGLLLGGDALNAWRLVEERLLSEDADEKSVAEALSRLRTEMKIELGVREESERLVPFASRATRRRR